MAVVLHVFEPLGEKWYATVNFNKSHVIHPRLKITESSISGFSAGAILTANIMSMEPETFTAAGIFAGMLPP